jgi:hypothetical protein
MADLENSEFLEKMYRVAVSETAGDESIENSEDDIRSRANQSISCIINKADPSEISIILSEISEKFLWNILIFDRNLFSGCIISKMKFTNR